MKLDFAFGGRSIIKARQRIVVGKDGKKVLATIATLTDLWSRAEDMIVAHESTYDCLTRLEKQQSASLGGDAQGVCDHILLPQIRWAG